MTGEDVKKITLADICEILEAEVHCNHHLLSEEVERAAAGDLMSDLLRIAIDGAILLTGLNNVQSVRTCVVTNMKALILVRGKRPSQEVIDEALLHGLPVLSTRYSLFTSCGKLYGRGIKGLQ